MESGDVVENEGGALGCVVAVVGTVIITYRLCTEDPLKYSQIVVQWGLRLLTVMRADFWDWHSKERAAGSCSAWGGRVENAEQQQQQRRQKRGSFAG